MHRTKLRWSVGHQRRACALQVEWGARTLRGARGGQPPPGPLCTARTPATEGHWSTQRGCRRRTMTIILWFSIERLSRRQGTTNRILASANKHLARNRKSSTGAKATNAASVRAHKEAKSCRSIFTTKPSRPRCPGCLAKLRKRPGRPNEREKSMLVILAARSVCVAARHGRHNASQRSMPTRKLTRAEARRVQIAHDEDGDDGAPQRRCSLKTSPARSRRAARDLRDRSGLTTVDVARS